MVLIIDQFAQLQKYFNPYKHPLSYLYNLVHLFSFFRTLVFLLVSLTTGRSSWLQPRVMEVFVCGLLIYFSFCSYRLYEVTYSSLYYYFYLFLLQDGSFCHSLLLLTWPLTKQVSLIVLQSTLAQVLTYSMSQPISPNYPLSQFRRSLCALRPLCSLNIGQMCSFPH